MAPISRRTFLGRLGAGAAAAFAIAAGWVPRIGRTLREAAAAVRWTLRAPLTGNVGSLSYHCGGASPCDNALDFFAGSGTKVLLYILSDGGAAGSATITSKGDSCSTSANPSQRRLKWDMYTDGGTFISRGVASHIATSLEVNNTVSGNGGSLGNIEGNVSVPDCYDPIHVHYGAPDMATVAPPTGDWPNRSVTAGQDVPWEKYL